MLSRFCATRTGHRDLPNPARLCFILSYEVLSGPNAGIVLISISSFPLLQISTRHGPLAQQHVRLWDGCLYVFVVTLNPT